MFPDIGTMGKCGRYVSGSIRAQESQEREENMGK